MIYFWKLGKQTDAQSININHFRSQAVLRLVRWPVRWSAGWSVGGTCSSRSTRPNDFPDCERARSRSSLVSRACRLIIGQFRGWEEIRGCLIGPGFFMRSGISMWRCVWPSVRPSISLSVTNELNFLRRTISMLNWNEIASRIVKFSYLRVSSDRQEQNASDIPASVKDLLFLGKILVDSITKDCLTEESKSPGDINNSTLRTVGQN